MSQSNTAKRVKENDIDLKPGDCFGWYSSVSSDCSSCMRGEWCRSYTITRANQSNQSMKKDIDELGTESQLVSETVEQKKQKNKDMAELGKKAFFQHVVKAARQLIEHDNVKISTSGDTASLKVRGRVAAFLCRKRSSVILELGGRNKGGPVMQVGMENDVGNIGDLLKPFIQQHSSNTSTTRVGVSLHKIS